MVNLESMPGYTWLNDKSLDSFLLLFLPFPLVFYDFLIVDSLAWLGCLLCVG